MGKVKLVELDDLWDELQRGRVYEARLKSSYEVVEGLQDGESVFVDPRPAILETLLHELLHRRKPRLSEKTVNWMARYMVLRMDESTKARWWREYQKLKKVRQKPVEVE